MIMLSTYCMTVKILNLAIRPEFPTIYGYQGLEFFFFISIQPFRLIVHNKHLLMVCLNIKRRESWQDISLLNRLD